MAEQLSVGSSLKCQICETQINNEISLGEKLTLRGFVFHYYCVLLSTENKQRGADNEGICGFLFSDIVSTISKSRRIKCAYCNYPGASIQCHICKISFHLPCGLLNKSISVFKNNFHSYCMMHRPVQNVPESVMMETRAKTPICVMCWETVDVEDDANSMWAPCCKKAWFHRTCLQELALSQAAFFKCPVCSNKRKFKPWVVRFGIYIPYRDASWEEPGAYDSLEIKVECNVMPCLCPDGRNNNTVDTHWELIKCNVCGSVATHLSCSFLSSKEWQCRECQDILCARSKENVAPFAEYKNINCSNKPLILDKAIENTTTPLIETLSSENCISEVKVPLATIQPMNTAPLVTISSDATPLMDNRNFDSNSPCKKVECIASETLGEKSTATMYFTNEQSTLKRRRSTNEDKERIVEKEGRKPRMSAMAGEIKRKESGYNMRRSWRK